MKQPWLDIKYDKENYWDKLQAYLNPSEPLPKLEPVEDRMAVINDLNVYADMARTMYEKDLYSTPGAIIAEDIMIFLSMRSVYDTNSSPYAWISSENEPILSEIMNIASSISIAEHSTPEQWKILIQLISELD